MPDSARLIARLEQTIVADTALNQFRLRPVISTEIARRGGEVEFATQSVTLRMGTLVGFVRIDHAPSVAPPFTAEELAQILARRLAAVRDGAANRPAVLELG